MWRHPKHYPLYLLFLLSLATCILPFLYRIPVSETYLFLVIAVPVITLQIALTLRTVAIACEVRPTISYLDSRQITWAWWWAVMQKRVGWHLAANALKIGLALAIMQYFSAMSTSYQRTCEYPQHPLSVLCYSNFYDYKHVPARLPQHHKALLSTAGLILLGTAEAGLSAALGIFSFVFTRRAFAGILLRGGFVMVAFLAFLAVDEYIYEVEHRDYGVASPYTWVDWMNAQDQVLLLQPMILGVSAVGEGGLFAAANLMRPYKPSNFHVLLMICSLVLGAVLPASLTVLFLNAAQRRLQKDGFSPPRRRPSLLTHLQQNLHPSVLQRSIHALRFAELRGKQIGVLSLLLIAIVINFSPNWIYMDERKSAWLLMMLTVTLTAQVVVTLYSLNVATALLSREYHDNAFDLLCITDVGSRRLIFSQWWAVIRHTWLVYLLTVPIKFGMAYAVSQYLYAMPYASYMPPIGHAFNYVSYGSTRYPQPYQFILTMVMIGLLSLAEMGMVAAIGLFSAVLTKGKGTRTPLLMLVLRLLPLLIVLGFMGATAHLNGEFISHTFNAWGPKNGEIIAYEYKHWLRVLENFQVAASSIIDGGVMAGANLLRPVNPRVYYIVDTLLSFGWGILINGMVAADTLWAASSMVERGR